MQELSIQQLVTTEQRNLSCALNQITDTALINKPLPSLENLLADWLLVSCQLQVLK